MPDAALLSVAGLQAWYGESHILHGVEFEVRRGEVVTLLGRNGAGKTTTLKSVMGMVARREGSVRFEGKEISTLTPKQMRDYWGAQMSMISGKRYSAPFYWAPFVLVGDWN